MVKKGYRRMKNQTCNVQIM